MDDEDKGASLEIPSRFIAALRLGTILVAELNASRPELRAWVAIVPHEEPQDREARRDNWKASIADRAFTVLLQEFDRVSIENDTEPHVSEIKRQEVIGEQALRDILLSWRVPLDTIQFRWDTDYPW